MMTITFRLAIVLSVFSFVANAYCQNELWYRPGVGIGFISDLAISANGNSAIVVGEDGLIRQWDLKSRKLLSDSKSLNLWTAIALTAEPSRVLLGDAFGRFYSYDLTNTASLKLIGDASAHVEHFRLSKDVSKVLVQTVYGIRIFETSTGATLSNLIVDGIGDWWTDTSIVTYEAGKVKISGLTGQVLSSQPRVVRNPRQLFSFANGFAIVTEDELLTFDRDLKLQEQHTLKGQYSNAALSFDKRMITVTAQQGILTFDIEAKEVRELPALLDFTHVEFSSTGFGIGATRTSDVAALEFDASTPSLLTSHRDIVTHLQPSGSGFATASYDGTIAAWSTSGERVNSNTVVSSRITCAIQTDSATAFATEDGELFYRDKTGEQKLLSSSLGECSHLTILNAKVFAGLKSGLLLQVDPVTLDTQQVRLAGGLKGLIRPKQGTYFFAIAAGGLYKLSDDLNILDVALYGFQFIALNSKNDTLIVAGTHSIRRYRHDLSLIDDRPYPDGKFVDATLGNNGGLLLKKANSKNILYCMDLETLATAELSHGTEVPISFATLSTEEVAIGYYSGAIALYSLGRLNVMRSGTSRLEAEVYPNPAHTTIRVVTSMPIEHVVINDVLGKQVIYSQDPTIGVSLLPTGIYTVSAITSQGVERVKLSVHH